MEYRRTLVFALPSGTLPPALVALLADYRLLVNRLIRFLLANDKTALRSLTSFARTVSALEGPMNWHHVSTAMQVARSLAKGHRRRVRKKIGCRPPYVRKPFLRADDASFHFDPESGHVRMSIRNGEWVGFSVNVPSHHRAVLRTAGTRVKQLVVLPDRLVLVWARDAPAPYAPKAVLALDTNESSLDGVLVNRTQSRPARAEFPEVRVIQARHYQRRRKMQQKKAHDRRVARRLLGREGRREHHRVEQRLHAVSNALITFVRKRRAAIVLEDLTMRPRFQVRRVLQQRSFSQPRGRALPRRLSSWPRRELHRQIFYKAEERGIPVHLVNPRYTSTTCPKCGERISHRSRVGAVFECPSCGFTKDRQLNAGLNIARTVLGEHRELGGLRLDLDVLSDDAMNLLYSPTPVGAHGTSGRRGRDR